MARAFIRANSIIERLKNRFQTNTPTVANNYNYSYNQINTISEEHVTLYYIYE